MELMQKRQSAYVHKINGKKCVDKNKAEFVHNFNL